MMLEFCSLGATSLTSELSCWWNKISFSIKNSWLKLNQVMTNHIHTANIIIEEKNKIYLSNISIWRFSLKLLCLRVWWVKYQGWIKSPYHQIGNSKGHGDVNLWLPIFSFLLLVNERQPCTNTDCSRSQCFVADTQCRVLHWTFSVFISRFSTQTSL